MAFGAKIMQNGPRLLTENWTVKGQICNILRHLWWLTIGARKKMRPECTKLLGQVCIMTGQNLEKWHSNDE